MPGAIRILHVADTHFGVETYGRLDPATGINTRLADFRDSLCRAIDAGLERGVHAALFAGDAYKSRDPSQTQQREFARCVRRLTERGIPVVMLTGNHDVPGVRGRAHAVEIFRTLGVSNAHIIHAPAVIVIDTPAGPLQIAGMPYLMKGFLLAREEFQGKTASEVREKMETRYREQVEQLAAELNPDLPTVLMGHFWVEGARLSTWQNGYFNPNEPRVPVSLLTRPGVFDYVALGHIHRHQDLHKGNQPPVVYCGSPDYIDFGERNEDKGCVIATVRKGNASPEFVPLPGGRRLIEIEVDAQGDSPLEAILEEIGRHNLRDNIVRLTYRVTPEGNARAAAGMKAIKQALAPAFLVVAIRADVQRDQASRSRALTESLDPMTALTRYLDSHERLSKRKDELMGYAESLMEELRRNESAA